ncbi:hypothetical protein N7G274_001747 [Stereocaulon virgatum]|uniref:RING-CH-type domain-containing protein n=1 Tax=Stereocaulon virgatum TaxID=373712 RepID=A0ABR4ALE1_9LECA
MASRPPIPSLPQRQQSSQQRTSSPTAPDDPASQQRRRSSIPQSATSEDSQTVFLNHPLSSDSSPKPEDIHRQASPRRKPQRVPTSQEPRKCWICFSDETEDNPTSSEWRSPCPCALTAHEACLLDWVAAEENTNSRPSARKKIQCPQCKEPIMIARPRSLVVEGVQAVERATGRLLVPFAVVTVLGTVITGCWMHGFSTVYLIFGPEDAENLLGIDSHLTMNSNWGLGLPFIPITLFAARTTVADNLLPILPIFYFASNTPRRYGPLWPPSAAMTLATLPYIRAAYNEFYTRVLAPKEKAWVKEIQPRAGEDGGNEGQAEEEQANNVPGDGMNFEVDLQLEIIEDDEEGEAPQLQQERPARNPPGEDHVGANPNQNQNPNQGQNRNLAHERHNHVHAGGQRPGAILFEPLKSAQAIIGALVFPSISAAMGAMLKAVLPRTWTTPPSRWDRYPPGFLQSRFGRSIVGGCLFIVLKDTLSLYSKYRMAQNHRMRKVVDYKPTRARQKAGSKSL